MEISVLPTYDVELAGWKIIFDSALSAIKEGKQYKQWLQEFSSFDANNPNKREKRFINVWNHAYTFSLKDKLVITTGNAGDIVVSIGGKVMGKLGKKGEVLDSISISPDYFSN